MCSREKRFRFNTSQYYCIQSRLCLQLGLLCSFPFFFHCGQYLHSTPGNDILLWVIDAHSSKFSLNVKLHLSLVTLLYYNIWAASEAEERNHQGHQNTAWLISTRSGLWFCLLPGQSPVCLSVLPLLWAHWLVLSRSERDKDLRESWKWSTWGRAVLSPHQGTLVPDTRLHTGGLSCSTANFCYPHEVNSDCFHKEHLQIFDKGSLVLYFRVLKSLHYSHACNLLIVESQTHRINKVGKDLQDHPVQPSTCHQYFPTKPCPSVQLLNVSWIYDHAQTYLGDFC